MPKKKRIQQCAEDSNPGPSSRLRQVASLPKSWECQDKKITVVELFCLTFNLTFLATKQKANSTKSVWVGGPNKVFRQIYFSAKVSYFCDETLQLCDRIDVIIPCHGVPKNAFDVESGRTIDSEKGFRPQVENIERRTRQDAPQR